MQRYWRLKNTWIFLVVSITLHAEACLFTDNKFGLFFSLMRTYMQKIKVKYQYFQEILTNKFRHPNPRVFWGMCSHVSSKVIDCACFFHLYIYLHPKNQSQMWIHPFKRHWWLQNSNVLMELFSISVTTEAIVWFFKKEN